MYRILLFSFLLLVLFNECKTAEPTHNNNAISGSFNPEIDIIVRQDPQSGNYKIVIAEALLEKSLKMADRALAEVEKIFVQPSSSDHVYLVFHAFDTVGNSIKKAVYLRQFSKGIYKTDDAAHTKEPICHSCEGSCCTDCNFRIADNKLHGCECKKQCDKADEETAGYCNHIIGKKVTMILAPLGSLNK